MHPNSVYNAFEAWLTRPQEAVGRSADSRAATVFWCGLLSPKDGWPEEGRVSGRIMKGPPSQWSHWSSRRFT